MEYCLYVENEFGDKEVIFTSYYETVEELTADLKTFRELFRQKVFAEEIEEVEEVW